MSRFLYHTSCPKCGSRDNRGVYEGGSEWCFGCRDYKRSSESPYVSQYKAKDHDYSEDNIILPDDASHDYNDPGLSWLLKYDLTIPELIKHNVYWSQYRKQVLFSWYSSDGELLAYQARNFAPGSKSKCYTQGDVQSLLPIYHKDPTGRSSTLVLVEDPVSAIKVSRRIDCMPCLTSTLHPTKINRLARLYGAFVVWLDGNMLTNAQQVAQRFHFLGCEARVVYTKEDPKEQGDNTIEELTQS